MGTLASDGLNKTKFKPPWNVAKNIYRAITDLLNLFGKITKRYKNYLINFYHNGLRSGV